jgi:hypothetical protein
VAWYFYIAHFIAALLFANAVPHFVNGISGRPFISPFGKPPGRGESSPLSNVLWAGANVLVGGVILWFWPLAMPLEALDVIVCGVGFFLAAAMLAQTFGQRIAEGEQRAGGPRA